MSHLSRFVSLSCLLSLVVANTSVAQDAEKTRISTFAELDALVTRDNVNHDADMEGQYIVCPTKKGPINSVMVVRWALSDGVAHFIQVIPMEISPERFPAMESAIVRINHAYPVPGLGYNHEMSTLYYRFTVPLLPQGFLTEDEVREYFSYVINQAATLQPTLLAVSKGEVKPAEVMKYHNARLSAPETPAGSYSREMNGSTWTIEFSPDFTVRLFRDKQVVVLSQATVKNDVIRFEDTAGPFKAEGPGTYTFSYNAEGLVFTIAEDNDNGRETVLTDGPWVKQ